LTILEQRIVVGRWDGFVPSVSDPSDTDSKQYIHRRLYYMLGDSLTADANRSSVPNEHCGRKSSKFWEPEFAEGAIIEYSCGNCHKNVYYALWNATYCPHCSAPIFNFPRRKLDAPQHRGVSYDDQEKMKYAGPKNDRPRHLGSWGSSEPPKDHCHRPGSKAGRRAERV
jgi:DNA-directed RNA polymerase subunit RPC12/RpoP